MLNVELQSAAMRSIVAVGSSGVVEIQSLLPRAEPIDGFPWHPSACDPTPLNAWVRGGVKHPGVGTLAHRRNRVFSSIPLRAVAVVVSVNAIVNETSGGVENVCVRNPSLLLPVSPLSVTVSLPFSPASYVASLLSGRQCLSAPPLCPLRLQM